MYQNQSQGITSRDIRWTLKAVFERQDDFWTLNSHGSTWTVGTYRLSAARTRKNYTLKRLLPRTNT